MTDGGPLRRRLLVAGLLLALLAPAVLAVRDALAARSALRSARASVRQARTALGAGEAAGARGHVQAARRSVAAARHRTDGPLWAVAGHLPVLDRSVGVLRGIVGVADAGVGLAAAAVDRADRLLGTDGAVPAALQGGRIDPAPLGDAADAAGSLPTAPLARARERLADLGTALVPGPLRDRRREALRVADRALTRISEARRLLAALPTFLGTRDTRRYLLAMQSPAELRGTGGLLGFYVPLVLDDGRVRVGDTTGLRAVTRAGAGIVRTGPLALPPGGLDPVATTDAHARRYGHVAGNRNVSNVNLDPDLPTTAPVLLDLHEQRTGERFDGMIVLDPLGVAEVMRALGPLTVPAAVRDRAGRIPARVAPDELAPLTLQTVYTVYGQGESTRREAFFGAFVDAALDRLLAAGASTAALARRVGAAATGRHLQVHSRHPREQAAFEAAGVAGHMPAVGPGQDLLALTANNASGGKQDVWVAHSLTGTLRLTLPSPRGGTGAVRAERRGTLRVALENPLPSGGMDLSIIGSCRVDRPEMQCFEDRPGLNRTWFTLWGPPDLEVTAARDHRGRPLSVGAGRIHGHRAVDHTLETPPGTTRSFELDVTGPVTLRRDGGDLRYELLLWRQAKAIPDHLDLTVRAPAGWSVAAADVTGGGDGSGMGARPDGPRLSARVVDDGRAVRLRGAATADARLRIRLTRTLADRLAGWLP